MLAKASFQRIEACPLDQLLERTGSAEFVLTIPRPAHQSKHHSAAKLQRQATDNLLSSPAIAVGTSLRQHLAPRLRHAPPVLSTYAWSLTRSGVIAGRPLDAGRDLQQTITHQEDDSVQWR
uniref:RxLR effector candidate protein n=1 Tax=Hyaloperonospora arabidopsidis (strain Emoy2) TaxID=559515 RepID=M4BYI3_HYAAE